MQNLKINNMNKKGLSEIVSTIMIILIAILALTVLSTLVIKIAKAPQLAPEYNCLNSKFNQQLKIESTCYNQEQSQIEIKVKRNLQDQQLDTIGFVTDNNQQFECGGNSCSTCNILQQGNTITYYLITNNQPERITIQANSCILETKSIQTC